MSSMIVRGPAQGLPEQDYLFANVLEEGPNESRRASGWSELS